jgi:hypothetical protein
MLLELLSSPQTNTKCTFGCKIKNPFSVLEINLCFLKEKGEYKGEKYQNL